MAFSSPSPVSVARRRLSNSHPLNNPAVARSPPPAASQEATAIANQHPRSPDREGGGYRPTRNRGVSSIAVGRRLPGVPPQPDSVSLFPLSQFWGSLQCFSDAPLGESRGQASTFGA